MKTRESGMPEEELWQGFSQPDELLRLLELDAAIRDVVDLGCGYGTFAIPAAEVITGRVHALDLDMVAATQHRAGVKGLSNVRCYQRDLVAQGTGLAAASVDYAMLSNLLHGDAPHVLLDLHEYRDVAGAQHVGPAAEGDWGGVLVGVAGVHAPPAAGEAKVPAGSFGGTGATPRGCPLARSRPGGLDLAIRGRLAGVPTGNRRSPPAGSRSDSAAGPPHGSSR